MFGNGLTGSDDLGQSAYDKKVRDALQHPQKAAKTQLAGDTLALQTDPGSLGMSEVERQKRIAEATQQATAQQQASITSLNQSALAGQGFQQGAFQQAAKDASAGVADATAKATVGVNSLNDQMINSEKQRILQEMEAARQRKAETARFWRDVGIDSVKALVGFAAPALAPALAGIGNSAPPEAAAPPPQATITP